MADSMRKRISVAGIRNDFPRSNIHASSTGIDFELLDGLGLCFEDNVPYLIDLSAWAWVGKRGSVQDLQFVSQFGRSVGFASREKRGEECAADVGRVPHQMGPA